MKNKIIAQDKIHLDKLIHAEIAVEGYACNLNHIDVSKITDLQELFDSSNFNGDISQWDVSNVTNMYGVFARSKFNGNISKWNVSKVTTMDSLFFNSKFDGDISNWDVSNVTHMACLFERSKFNGDISGWDVSNVANMFCMFSKSEFTGDLSKWKPYSLHELDSAFHNAKCPIPFWGCAQNNKQVVTALNGYYLAMELDEELKTNGVLEKRIKV